jgi:hypothetical protein
MKVIGALVCLPLALTLVGCGGGAKASVKGKVAYGSRPVKVGEVVIFGGDGVPRTGKINRDGTYEVTDLVSGSGKVAVRSTNPKELAAQDRDPKAKPDPVDLKNWFLLPPSYADPNTSGLTVTIQAGANAHDLNLAEKQGELEELRGSER